ncbi:hypothetical protein SKAU_G00267030 [Synaphobranchus kaupii]|uniref:Uncharacterized protein n=1 Tax=Synaphobranchus kaupii TaxID=118154 RepID=A0A9Q1EZF2_SYNKA|nr:hypothetical protein SKAU_G00267030 [Synaphobranchus kaupii]
MMKYMVLVIALLHFGRGNDLLNEIIVDLTALTKYQDYFYFDVEVVLQPNKSMQKQCNCSDNTLVQSLNNLLAKVKTQPSEDHKAIKTILKQLQSNLKILHLTKHKHSSNTTFWMQQQ